MRNELPGDAGLPPGVRQADIDDPETIDEQTGWPEHVMRDIQRADELEGADD